MRWSALSAARKVALLAEGVDRNPDILASGAELTGVALLAEGVDRNPRRIGYAETAYMVALLAEGVDRNWYALTAAGISQRSPSSRRAWIEI